MTTLDKFRRKAAADPLLRSVRRKAEAGTADFHDTARYSERAAEILGETLSADILSTPHGERAGACEALLHEQYADTCELLCDVQEALDAETGLYIAPQVPEYPEERVEQVAQSLEDETVPDETIERRARSAPENVAKAFHDAYMRENAKFRSAAGVKCQIVREGNGCCPWCAQVAGKYEYGDEPDDVYRRHDNCTCTVIFENGKQRQDVWSKRTWEAPASDAGAGEPTVFSDDDRPTGFVPTVLTNWLQSGTISIEKARDIQAARFLYNKMSPQERAEVIMRGIRELKPIFSYNTPENRAMEYLEKVAPLPNTFDVISHGAYNCIEFFKQDYPPNDNRANIDAFTLATILRGREDFQAFLADCEANGVEPCLRLLACSTGDTTDTGNCFAQLLANELGMLVLAPTDIIYAYPDGSYKIGLLDDGEMKIFWWRV